MWVKNRHDDRMADELQKHTSIELQQQIAEELRVRCSTQYYRVVTLCTAKASKHRKASNCGRIAEASKHRRNTVSTIDELQVKHRLEHRIADELPKHPSIELQHQIADELRVRCSTQYYRVVTLCTAKASKHRKASNCGRIAEASKHLRNTVSTLYELQVKHRL